MLEAEFSQRIELEYRKRFASKPFVPGETGIPPSGKCFDASEMVNMIDAVLDGWWTEGRWTKEFETAFAAYLGRPFCTTTNSGSSANLLAFASLTSVHLGERRLKPGDEVISVAAGFPTTIMPILQYGCVPVFVDVDPQTYNVRVEDVVTAWSPKTRAVMIAHTLGNPFPVKEIAAFCKEKNLWLIEDTCDALGSTYDGQLVGTFGDISTFSFYPAHHITMGEGGALTTSNAQLNKIIRSFRDWGRDCWCSTGCDNTCGIRFEWKKGLLPKGYDHKYIYSEPGYNLKITDIQAALGLAQLKKLSQFIQSRRDNHRLLTEYLQKWSHVFQLPVATSHSDPSWFGFVLTLKESAPFTRHELIQHLQTNRIGTRYLFAGNILRQPVFTDYQFPHRISGSLDQTNIITERTFWIGCYPGLTSKMLRYVSDTIDAFCRSYGLQSI